MRLLTPANANAAEVALRTGLRISDVLGLRTEQISRGNRITVREQKTGKSRRIYLGNDIREKLLRQAGEKYIWEHANDPERHRTRQAVYKDVKRAAKALRLNANVAPHSMRKIFAVDYYRKHGLDATRKMLNHDSTATTLIYILSELAQ
jgi:integrase